MRRANAWSSFSVDAARAVIDADAQPRTGPVVVDSEVYNTAGARSSTARDISNTMAATDQDLSDFDNAAEQIVTLGNRLLDRDEEADQWEVASGLLAGAVHFWLYARQPCGDPTCESCTEVDTAEKRLRKLIDEVTESAKESEYYHSPHDTNVGRA